MNAINLNTSNNNFSSVDLRESTFASYVSEIALGIFEVIREVVAYPLHYVGAKSWSIPGILLRTPIILFKHIVGLSDKTISEDFLETGYQTKFESELGPEEVKPFLSKACIAAYAHVSENDLVESFGYRRVAPSEIVDSGITTLEAKEKYFFSPSGLKVSVVEKGNRAIIAFGGVGAHKSETQLTESESRNITISQVVQGTANLLGPTMPIFHEMDAFFSELITKDFFQGKQIELVGHCFGGLLAQYLTLKHQEMDMQAYCINSLAMGTSMQNTIGKKALSKATDRVTHVSVQGDIASDHWIVNKLDTCLSAFGLRTAGNFGKRYVIPSAYNTFYDRHVYAIGSMMSLLGHGSRTKPQDVVMLRTDLYLNF